MSTEDPNLSYDRDRWLRILEEMSIALGKEGDPVEVCLIGSASCVLGGMEGRTTIDLDVWAPNSDFDELELKQAVIQAGLLFDPKTEHGIDQAYIQLVEPGLVQLGIFTSILIKRLGRLRITRPPYENLIASKLIRANRKDIQDIQYLMQVHRPDIGTVREIIESLPPQPREIAKENLIYLEILK